MGSRLGLISPIPHPLIMIIKIELSQIGIRPALPLRQNDAAMRKNLQPTFNI